jgi:uncharacterized protein (DUF885 family)
MTTEISPAHAIADELRQVQLEHDQEMALWNGDVTYLERWPDFSSSGTTGLAAVLRDIADRADATPATTSADQTLVEAVAFGARSAAILLGTNATLTAIHPAEGLVAAMFVFLPRYPLVTADHGARYHAKLRSFPDFVEGWCERLRAAADDGIVPIRHLVEREIGLLDEALATPLSAGPLAAQQPPVELDAAGAEAWAATLQSILDADVMRGLASLRATLADHTLAAALPDDRPGLVHIDGGAEEYGQRLWAFTSLDLAPEQVHRIGLEQVARLEAEYLQIAAPVLGTTDLVEIYRRLREDPELHYRDADTLVADATRALDRATAAVGPWFGITPTAPCAANPTRQGSLAFYSPPSMDGTKDGAFFFNTADPGVWGTFQLEAVTFHEGIPGHHLQMALARELPGMHPILADYLVPSYSEGWALYTERLADEMGLYSSELDRIGMLSADSMRACRLVVDTGMHALGWTRDQAITYFLDHAPMTHGQVIGEVDRYIGNPGQACAYMLGRLTIEDIRSDAEQRLGEHFDIRAFHDHVLATGSIPLGSLRRVVGAWIDEVVRAAGPGTG